MWSRALPRTMSCEPLRPLGFSRMGFISTDGASPQASAWAAWARPISPPVRVTNELLDMFCALNGATRIPFRRSSRQNAVVTQLLPALEEVPRIARAFMRQPGKGGRGRRRDGGFRARGERPRE